MNEKVLISHDFSGVKVPAVEDWEPDTYSFSNVAERRQLDMSSIPWLTENAYSELLASSEKLKANLISALILSDALPDIGAEVAPDGMVDSAEHPNWLKQASAICEVANALGVYLVSYVNENSGALFVHLVPQTGDSLSASKSRGKLRGHTDAVAMPFPHETNSLASGCPSPDLVILACLRNPNLVPTRVAPLSEILKRVDRVTIEQLQQPAFDIHPQLSFTVPEGHRMKEVPVLFMDQFDGFRIRFSHSKIEPSDENDEAARAALLALQEAVAASYLDLPLRPGELLLLNNRTSIHGRGEVSSVSSQKGDDRWIIRSYGMHHSPALYNVDEHREYALGQ